MAAKAGGGSRFKGAGSLWKSSWKGRVPFDSINFISGFSNQVGGQYYEGGAVLDIDPAGSFVGAVVGLQELPGTTQVIARNGGNANEGWTLDLVPVAGGLRFRFTVFDGVGVAAQVTSQGNPVSLANVDPLVGDPNRVYIPVIGAFISAVLFPPDGAIALIIPGQVGTLAAVPLGSPYLNNVSALTVGVGGGVTSLDAPNVLNGLVGGTAPWGPTVTPEQDIEDTFDAWVSGVESANQIVAVPDPLGIGVVTTNGWRAPGPNGLSPDPLPPFIGASPLTYAMGDPGVLTLGHDQPSVFYPDNLNFPYT